MEQGTPATTPPAAGSGEDKTVAILAYITLIGFIIAIVMHGQKKTRLGSYHLKQALGLIITGFALGILGFIFALITLGFGALLLPLIWLLLLVMVIMGIVNAANGQEKPTIILGKSYEKWFANAFN